jgi:pimeloyl-ACP methyl ester carboxylesterase
MDKRASNYLETIPKTTEIVPPTTLMQQFNAIEKWLDTNWSGVCSQLPNMSKPTLIIIGTEDVAVPAANSLILVQKIPRSLACADERSWTWINVSVSR